MPDDGGTWFIDVNGARHAIRDMGGWDFHNSTARDGNPLVDAQWTHRFEVPLDRLREHEWNTIAIGSTGSGSQFLRFGGTSDWILPEEHCRLSHVAE